MFKLVGRENFTIGKNKCTITIESSSGYVFNVNYLNEMCIKHGIKEICTNTNLNKY